MPAVNREVYNKKTYCINSGSETPGVQHPTPEMPSKTYKCLQKRATPEGLHKAQYEYEDLAKGFAQVASKKRVVGSPQAHE
jgi:hypothetical protein